MHLLKVRRSTRIQTRSRDNGPLSADMAQIPRQRASARRYSPDPETTGQRPQIQPRSRDTGPLSPDTAQIPRQRAVVPRYGPDPETMDHCPQIQLRSRDNGPLSADTAQNGPAPALRSSSRS